MLRSLSSRFRYDRAHAAAHLMRRQRRSFGRGVELLEGRSLLSTVGGPNQAPVLASPGTQIVEEGNSLAVQAHATDPDDGQRITYSLDPGAPDGATIDPSSGLFVWTPPNVQTMYSITIRATDNGSPSLSDAKTLVVMVFDVPPTVQAGANATINQGAEFLRTGSFSDPNPDTWSATVDYGDGSGDQTLTLNPNHTFQLAHTYTTAGSYIVAITIVDSQGFQGRGFLGVQVQTPSTPVAPNPTQTQATSGTTSTQAASGLPQVQAQTQTQAHTQTQAQPQGQSSFSQGRSTDNTSSDDGSTQTEDGVITALRKGPRIRARLPHGPRAHRHR